MVAASGDGATVAAHVVESDSYDRATIVRLRRASHAWRALDEDGAKLVPHFPTLVEDLFCALFKMNVLALPAERVAPSAAFSETRSASRTPGLSIARPNHFVVKPSIGHTSDRLSLNA